MSGTFDFIQSLFGTEAPKTQDTAAQSQDAQQLLSKRYLKPFGLDATLTRMPQSVQGYRADPQGRFGGQDGMETQPTSFANQDVPNLYANARAMARSRSLGVPQLSPQEFAAFALKEGDANFKARAIDTNNPNSVKMYDQLSKMYPQETARFLTVLTEKQGVAQRLGIPLAEAWNGTGRAPGTNNSGADYAQGYQSFLKAANHPKNKALVDFIQNAMAPEQ